MKSVNALTSAVAALVILSGCASGPPRQKVTVPLVAPVGLQADSNNPPVYVDVRAATIWVPAGTAPDKGVLWVRLNAAPYYAAWSDVKEITSDRDSRSIYWNVTLNSGLKAKTLLDFPFALCAPGVTPSASVFCPKVSEVSVAEVDLRAYSLLPATSYRKETSSWLFTSLSAFSNPEAAEAVRRRLVASYEANKRSEQSERQYKAEQARAEEVRRKDRVEHSPVGTEINCTSRLLAPRGEAINPSLPFDCPPIGVTSMSELRENGWSVRVTGRLQTKTITGYADSVEMEAVKKR